MLPSQPSNNRRDIFELDAVLNAELTLADAAGGVTSANLSDLFGGELGGAMQLAGLAPIDTADAADIFTIERDMRPSFATKDCAYGFSLHTEAIRDGLLSVFSGQVERANLGDLAGSQLGAADALTPSPAFGVRSRSVKRTPTMISPATSNDVCLIVGACASVKMGAIATRRVVAMVAYEFSGRVKSMKEHEGDAMRLHGSAGDLELAVSATELAALPKPASVDIADLNLRPKTGNVDRVERGQWLSAVGIHNWKYTAPTNYGVTV